MSNGATCLFCRIIGGDVPSRSVYDGRGILAFLDHRPLFPGHCLVVPKVHYVTLLDLPDDLLPSFFACVKLLTRAVQEAMEAEGTFVAVNNVVSQSVPHLHAHVVPRRRGDGLKGFFWPRRPYRDAAEESAVQAAIAAAVTRLVRPPG